MYPEPESNLRLAIPDPVKPAPGSSSSTSPAATGSDHEPGRNGDHRKPVDNSSGCHTDDPTSANTFGIVAESIDHNQSGYVITEGLITNINTSALVEDSAVYLSPTVAGGLTSTKPQAPQHNVYIGVCVKSNAG